MRVVVGLGNPGPGYEKTRHNVGFWVVERLAKRWGSQISRRAHRSLVGEAFLGGETVLLVKPQTFMNRSGEAVVRLRDFYHLPPSGFIVVHDDMDLAIGRIRVRENGGPGGHWGVESVIAALGARDFPRIKVGIGRPPAGEDPVDFVLHPFTPVEEESIFLAVERAVEAVEVLLKEGLQKAMSLFNVRGTGSGDVQC